MFYFIQHFNCECHSPLLLMPSPAMSLVSKQLNDVILLALSLAITPYFILFLSVFLVFQSIHRIKLKNCNPHLLQRKNKEFTEASHHLKSLYRIMLHTKFHFDDA